MAEAAQRQGYDHAMVESCRSSSETSLPYSLKVNSSLTKPVSVIHVVSLGPQRDIRPRLRYDYAMAESTDLEPLARYLNSDLSPDNCMGLSDLDGFLTAIVIGPEPIMPSEWLPVVWGNEEPAFKSESQMETLINLIMSRYNEIVTAFDADPEKFEPIFWKRSTGEVIVMDWAAGFLEAVEMRRTAWEPLFSHRRAKVLLEPLLILGDDGEHDRERDAGDRWKEFYASRPDVIPNCVLGIYNFWEDYADRRKPQPRRGRKLKR
jgi:uncharacterized protein